MKAVILAAGTESIPGLESGIPKCLIKLGEESLLERQIKIFKECGIKDISVVVGKKGECWNEETFSEVRKHCKEVILNDENLTTKNAYSLYLAIRDVDKGPVIVVDGDILFKKKTILSLLNSPYETSVVSRKADSLSEIGPMIIVEENRVVELADDFRANNFPWYLYGAIMKIGNDSLEIVKSILKKKEYQNKLITDMIRDILGKVSVHNLDPNEEDMFKLRGGSLASTKKVLIVRKEAVSGKDKLKDEINWLIGLPNEVKKHFTEVKDYDLNCEPVYYEMPFYEMPSFRKLILRGDVSSEKAITILDEICDFMFSEVYTKRKKKCFDNYAKVVNMNRVLDRIKESMERSKLFSKIIQSKSFVINGKEIPNIFAMLQRVERNPKLLKILQPEQVSMVHGDLHFDNILVDYADGKLNDFVLVDPRGLDHTYDYTYDMGKLWHSFYGMYDFIHENMFSLDIKFKGDSVVADMQISDCPALDTFKKIHEGFEKNLVKREIVKKDKYWKMRTLFSNVSHFCSMIPFHLKEDEKEKVAIGIYLRGLELFDEFLKEWENSKEYKKEILYDDWLNINTYEDYMDAQKIVSEKGKK